MSKQINIGIGFVTGRPNVCRIINSYYKEAIEQLKEDGRNLKLTFFILYDLGYQYTKRTDFYSIIPDVYKENIEIKYITPEDIEEEKKILISRYELSKEESNLFLGHGHAKGRNTVLYYALKNKMDYLLFWDDDEYPVACIKGENGEITWKKQNNITMHLKYIERADVSIGYHCGYISPIPYIDSEEIEEEILKDYIDALSNDIVDWNSIKEKFEKNNGVTFADPKIANGEGIYEIKGENTKKWVAGSTLCLNLRHIEKIPAFYNPPEARGEDTFFSTLLDESKVMKVPVYHFHDGFLKYTGIMKGNYPKTLRKIRSTEDEIEQRFLKASRGWIKYKPLLMYIMDKEHYEEKIKEVYEKLKKSIPTINTLFENSDFSCILKELRSYDKNVEKHYQEYLKINEIWNHIKNTMA